MNNAICIFVDSVTWNCIGTNRAKVSPTPFMDSLKKESLTTTNLYSHGPYTDAATHSLFTGRDCLDDFGYFFKLNTAPINHYKAFHDAGFETYDFNYPYYLIGKGVSKYIDHPIYATGFIYGSEWGGLYSYYHDIIQSRPLNDDEHLLLKRRIKVMFDSWEKYLEDTILNPESMMMHNKILETYDTKAALSVLREEELKFEHAPFEYIDDFIKKGKDHVLVSLDDSGIETYIDGTFLNNYVSKKYSKLFTKIAVNNFKANVFNNMPPLKRVLFALSRYLKTKDSTNLLFIQNYFGSLTTMRLMKKRWAKKGWQNQHSSHTMLKAGVDILEHRNNDKPFYMFFDTEDPHNNLAFFSYDIQDRDELDEEFRVLEDYVNELGTKFIGNLVYLLSLRYVDYQIQKFCESLKSLGLWENTTLLVIADHGSSYTFSPLHNRRVNNFDDECYHIPMLLHHPGMQGRVVSTYQYSKDVLPTFLDVLGIPQSDLFKGRSMLRETEARPYVIGEYMGPGCPDMLLRRIWFSARDKRFLIAYKVGLYEKFEDGELAEAYDLIKDPDALYNINDKIDKSEIRYLIDGLKERWEEIRRDTDEFMDKVRHENCSL